MVKGVSRQVIVVQSPGDGLFDQAIFILKKDAVHRGVTDEMLLRQAQEMIHTRKAVRHAWRYGPVWACGGAMLTGLVWLMTAIL